MKKIILISAFLIFANTALSASYKEALSLYEAKKYTESLKIIAVKLDAKKDMEKDSPNYDMRFLAAHNHWKLGNLQPAVLHFKKCAEIRKNIPDPLIDLSILMLESKRYGDANYFAFGALRIAENPIAYYVLGKSAMKTGNYLKAKEYFEKSISIDPEFGISYNDLGITLMELKKYGEANTAFSAALATMYTSPEVLNNMGMTLERAGKFDEAMKYYTKAFEKNSENRIIKMNLERLKGILSGTKKG